MPRVCSATGINPAAPGNRIVNFPTKYSFCGMAVTLRLLVLLLTFMTVAAGQVAPSFTTQPISQTGTPGGNVTFTVAATGTAPLAYQWYKDGSEVAGATGSSLTISGVKLSDGGSYQAAVRNVATRISAVSGGGDHTMYIKAGGTLWAMGYNLFGQLGDGTTTNRSSAVRVATGVASVAAGDDHTMYVKTDGTLWAMGYNLFGRLGDGTITNRSTAVNVNKGLLSDAATLAFAPAITTQPSSSTVISGGAASFSVVASGTSPLAYQWKKDGSSISGATSSTYTIASTQTTDAGSYTVVVTNSAGSVTSNPIVLTILAPRLYSLAVRTALAACPTRAAESSLRV